VEWGLKLGLKHTKGRSMAKRVVLVGHCGPDSSYLRMSVGAAEKGVQVVAADDEAALQRVLSEGVDLVLLNRVLDYGFVEETGVELVRRLRAEQPNLKMMLVSNYPEAQAEAVAAGALMGFGKRDLGSRRVAEKIQAVLGQTTESSAGARAGSTQQ
jgi:CheY-like chemotaxis protein